MAKNKYTHMSNEELLDMIMSKKNVKHYHNKIIENFKKSKQREHTTLKYIQKLVIENDIRNQSQLAKFLGISSGTVSSLLCGRILYKTKHKIFSKHKTDYFIWDDDGFILNPTEEVKNELYEIKRQIDYEFNDYKYHYIPEPYYKAFSFWSSLMYQHNYNYYNKALEISSKYYGVDKTKLEKYVRERIEDGKRYKKENEE